MTTETPVSSARIGAKIAMDLPEPVGRMAITLAYLGFRTARRRFFWFSLVKEGSGLPVYRDRTERSSSSSKDCDWA